MANPVYLSGSNGFVPSATGQAIAFVRDPKEFKVNEYTQVVNSPEPVGLYAVLDYDQPTRVVTDAEFAWEDGDPRPSGNGNLGNFQWVEFRCFRRCYPYTIGEQALQAAKGWNPKAFHNAIVLSQAMTNRTKRVVDLLETSSNWGANTADVNVLNGGAGKWSQGSADSASPYYNAVKKSLLEAARRINLATNSVVKSSDLVLVISPGTALMLSSVPEIHSYLKESQWALPQIRGDAPNQNMLWGLPETLYGFKLVVEDASRVNIRQTQSATGTFAYASVATGQRAYIKSDNSAVLMSRKGGLDGSYGSPSFSTLQAYFYRYELAVEAFDDPKNKRVEASVVEMFKEVLAAAPSGFLMTSLV